MNCTYHHDQPAVAVFKAHAPKAPITELENGEQHLDQQQYYANTVEAHNDNLFLCAHCVADEHTQVGATVERYAKIRTVPVAPDTLSDNWEKEWQLLYRWEWEWILAEPRAHVYYVGSGLYLGT